MPAPADLFALDGLTHAGLFAGLTYVWEALALIEKFTRRAVELAGPNAAALRVEGDLLARTVVIHQGRVIREGFQLLGGDPTKGQLKVRIGEQEVGEASVVHAGAVFMDDMIHIAPGAVIEPGALIKGPSFIGPRTEVRQGAYLRGGCLIGAACVVGHTTEVKNSVMLDGAKAGHFAYLGDSILGREVNLGAGTKLANLKIIDRPFRIKVGEVVHTIARRKSGAIMGDLTETGCNSVTNPGTVLGPRCLVAPCTSVPSGFHPPRSVIR
ncbi:MAG: glucose-1-phosphate thymidylyltransferase [Pseudomonadota bacterium]